MPTYEYQCSKCGQTFEAFQRMSDPPLKKCKKCGARGSVSRLISAGAGVIFKGSGFYATDYKRSGSSSVASKPPVETAKSDESKKAPEKKTDTPDTKKPSSSD